MYTVDASVFLSAYDTTEAGYEVSRRFLEDTQRVPGTRHATIIEPTLVLVEVAAAISRSRGEPDEARAFAVALERLPNLRLVSLDDALAHRAADVAATHRLRGADAVYAAVAWQAGCLGLSRSIANNMTESPPSSSPGIQ